MKRKAKSKGFKPNSETAGMSCVYTAERTETRTLELVTIADISTTANGSVISVTLDEVRTSKKEMLTPNDVAPILGVHPYSLNNAKRNGTLEFKAMFIGRRLLIPRIPFLKYMEDAHDE